MFTNSPQTNIPCFLSPDGSGKQDTVCKHVISPSCATEEANTQNVDKWKHVEDLHSLPCLWDVQSTKYKNRNKKVYACDTPTTKYGIRAIEVEKKIQTLKTQFRRERKKLVDSNTSGSSPKETLSKRLTTSKISKLNS
jgi:hypothetical protein